MIGVVLATDMSVHFSLMDEFKRQLDAQPSTSNWPDRGLLYRFIVHLADIANPARGFDMARRWAERVVAEFLQQVRTRLGAGALQRCTMQPGGACMLTTLCIYLAVA